MSSFNQLQWGAVTTLAKYLGEAVPAPQSSQLFLTIDDTLVISIRPACDSLLLGGMIDTIAADTGAEFWPALLAENLRLAQQCQGSLCLEAESELLLYVECLALRGKEPQQILDDFDRYLSTLLTLHNTYGAAAPNEFMPTN